LVSFAGADIAPVADLGIYAGIGVLLSFVYTDAVHYFPFQEMTQKYFEENFSDFRPVYAGMAVNGHKVWVIETVPRSGKVIDETGYKKPLIGRKFNASS